MTGVVVRYACGVPNRIAGVADIFKLTRLPTRSDGLTQPRSSIPAMQITVAQALEQAVELHRAGRFQDAEPIYRGILATVPDHQDALHLLGMIAFEHKRHEEAAELIGRAARIAPGLALFHHHLGIVLGTLGRNDEAAAALRKAIEIDPSSPGLRTELGLCLLREHEYDEALQTLKSALELDPRDAVAARNLGVCCAETGQLGDAEDYTRLAVAIDPDDAGGWNNLGGILISRGDPAGAAPMYEKACERNPGYAMAYSNRLMCEQYLPGVTQERLARLSAVWQERYAPSGSAPFEPIAERPVGGGLRLGFVSRDLKRAPVGYFLVGLFEALRTEAVSLVVYSDTEGPDDLTARMRQAASVWRETRPLSDEQLLRVVRDDAIDVLFDLAGHTKANRLPVFARRAAPIQITWAGYVGTTGLDAMDFVLADRFHVPVASEQFYRERVLRMPHGSSATSRPSMRRTWLRCRHCAKGGSPLAPSTTWQRSVRRRSPPGRVSWPGSRSPALCSGTPTWMSRAQSRGSCVRSRPQGSRRSGSWSRERVRMSTCSIGTTTSTSRWIACPTAGA